MNEVKKEKKITPLKAIRLKCLDCCCGQKAEVRLCNITDCNLFPFRFGKRAKKDIESNEISSFSHILTLN